jgi:UDP-glucose 4-epimerase
MKETSGSSGACVVAVTGAYGFIGRHVCDALQRGPYRVVKVNRSSEGVPDICSDLSNAAELARDLRADGVKVLVHSAWAGHPRSAGTDYPGQIRDSLVPTINTLLAAGLAGVDHVVLLGTGGGIPPARGATAPPAYGWAKRTAEGIALANASAFQFRLAIIRPSAVYGPGQDPSRGLGAVTVFADAILRNQPIRILGSDSVTRDFLHVGDLSEAVRCAVDAQLGRHLRTRWPRRRESARRHHRYRARHGSHCQRRIASGHRRRPADSALGQCTVHPQDRMDAVQARRGFSR